MSDPEPADGYVEIQVDRETVVLAVLAFVAIVVVAFFVGRWTAPSPVEGPRLAALEGDPQEAATQRHAETELEEVDGEPMFGGRPVSAAGAPPVAPVPDEPAPAPAREATPAPPPKSAEPVRPAARPPATAEEGWVVQVAAVKSARDAQSLGRRLQGKGYPVRILEEAGLSKVQVGPYASKRDAEEAERRLKREESLSTWVKRS